jgi:hypothetical protein
MDNSFYLELSEMAQEALDALDRYESTGQSGDVFDKIRAVGVPCLDGQKISQSVKDDLPIRDQLEFQRAIFSMANLSSLTGGRGKNSNIRAQISYVLSKSKTLSSRSKKTKTLKIFYSWQATLPSKTNRGLIRDCLDKAISEINKGLSIESRVSLDSDTSNTPGSPDIINTILEKIDSSQIFVADVSLVNTSQPNANVMFELGYAMKTLGDQNIIMVFNENYGATKDLPFDLGFKRQMLYSCSDSEEDMSSIRKPLTSKLKSAISLILDNE